MVTPQKLNPFSFDNSRRFLRLVFWLLAVWTVFGGSASALDSEDVLPVEQAFRISARMDSDSALFAWDIADGHYLYRKKFKFVSRTPGVDLGAADFPKGETKHDDYFGEMEIYRHQVEIRVPLARKDPSVESVALEVTAQGCADAGLCYPPHKQTVELKWPPRAVPQAAADPAARLDQSLEALGVKHPGRPDGLLPPDEAFRFQAQVKDAETLWVSWQIADGYFLYREKIKLALPGGGETGLGAFAIPRGEPWHDEEFGAVEVFHRELGFPLPLVRGGREAMTIRLQARFQGCAERGVCYPPMEKTVSLDLPAGGTAVSVEPTAGECAIGAATGFVEPGPLSEQCQVAAGLKGDSLGLTLASFLGMGLLLAFTPCIFPMIPILSGIIVGQGHRLTARRAFLLSLSYVLASALAYTVFGILAGLFGGNLQALLQDPRVIAATSALFVVLALSMFDLITLQLPAFLQTKLTALSNRQHGGTLAGAAAMGALSALVVGPCVAAPLAGALIYIGQTGDAVLGGLALFAMGLGMGIPLLAIGASAGKLLPRAGTWMNSVKAVFGVGMLAIAVWLLERILPPAAILFLWALLLIVPAIYLGALEALPRPVSGWRKLWKGLGIVMLSYGVLLLIGAAANSTDPLQPLRGLYAGNGRAAPQRVFRKVTSLPELDREIAEAAGQWVMLDFYADWCVSCKEMERYTFADPKVQERMRGMVLLQADVTANSESERALLKHFGLVGPPATLFFGPDRRERAAFRVVGYLDAGQFLDHLQKMVP